MKQSIKKLIITLLIMTGLVLISGCTDENPTQMPAPQQSTGMPSQTSSVAYSTGELNENPGAYSSGEISGKVMETLDAAGYTYIQLDDGTGPAWAAIPQINVELGTEGFISGGVMHEFHSSSLDKTFPAIIFAGGLQVTSTGVENDVNASATTNATTVPVAPASHY